MIDHLIVNATKKYSFDKKARQHIKLMVEDFIEQIVSECENAASDRDYQKKHIGVGITRQVINTHFAIQDTGDTQEKSIGEKEHDILEPEVA